MDNENGALLEEPFGSPLKSNSERVSSAPSPYASFTAAGGTGLDLSHVVYPGKHVIAAKLKAS